MKKLLILLMAVVFLMACGSSDDEEVIADEIDNTEEVDEAEQKEKEEETQKKEEQKAKEEEEAQKAKEEEKAKEEKEEAAKKAEKEKKEAVEEEKAKEAEKEKAKEDETEEANDEDITWDDVKEKDKIVGKSDKDFSEITKSKPSDVRNDGTGNWKKSTFAESVDIEDYLLSYYDTHMAEDEIHFIINFNYDTTTVVSEMGGLLYVDISEYEKKEEHDAGTIGNGMLLKSYIIYPDGDVQELDEL